MNVIMLTAVENILLMTASDERRFVHDHLIQKIPNKSIKRKKESFGQLTKEILIGFITCNF